MAPFPLALRTDSHYRFVCPEGGETRPQNAMFLEWLLNEAQEMLQFNEGRHIIHVADI